MNPYVVHGGDSEDCAILVFHYTAHKAKVLAWQESSILDELVYDGYFDVRVRRLEAFESTMAQMESDKPHVIDSPVLCEDCEFWGENMNEGVCDDCDDQRRD